MQYIATTSLRVIVNDIIGYSFQLEQGIRYRGSLFAIYMYNMCRILRWYIHFMSLQKHSGIDIKLDKDSPNILN